MRIYRVSFRRVDGDEHTGYGYYSSKRDADAGVRDASPHCKCTLEIIEVKPSKAGIISALELYGSHADNG
jgi:hypothetical protein